MNDPELDRIRALPVNERYEPMKEWLAKHPEFHPKYTCSDDSNFPVDPITHWIEYIDQELIIGQWYIVTNGKESFAAAWLGKNKWLSQNMIPRNDITYYMEFPAPPND